MARNNITDKLQKYCTFIGYKEIAPEFQNGIKWFAYRKHSELCNIYINPQGRLRIGNRLEVSIQMPVKAAMQMVHAARAHDLEKLQCSETS